MDKNKITQLEKKIKSLSFVQQILLSVVLGGGFSLVFVITRDILNMFI